jgi:hypothetical protein
MFGLAGGEIRAWSHYRFAPPLTHFIPDFLTYSVPLFLKRQCDRTLGEMKKVTGVSHLYAPPGHTSGSDQNASVPYVMSYIKLPTDKPRTKYTYKVLDSPHRTLTQQCSD